MKAHSKGHQSKKFKSKEHIVSSSSKFRTENKADDTKPNDLIEKDEEVSRSSEKAEKSKKSKPKKSKHHDSNYVEGK